MATKWERIAHMLGDRMANHAFCPAHPTGQPEDDCPFCQDRAAYLAYLAAGGEDARIQALGRSIPLSEIPSVNTGEDNGQ